MTPYLYTHQNPHAPRRSNGIRFWGYPDRQGGTGAIRHIVIHTAETTPSLHSAENVAKYQARVERPSSYHRIVDANSAILMLPDQAVAFGAHGANTTGLHLSFATSAHLWDDMPGPWTTQALIRAAAIAREWTVKYRVPVVRLSHSDWKAGRRGFIAHADVDPGRRTDPGREFPWARFLDLARHQQEDDVTEDDIEAIADRAADKVLERLQPDRGATVGNELDRLRRDVRWLVQQQGGTPQS